MFPITQRPRSTPSAAADDPSDLRVNPALEHLARWLDDAIPIPGTPWRIGLDGLIGLIPVVGDLATVFSGVLMLQEAQRLGLPMPKQALIAVHYAIDTLVGMVPVLGDLFDFAYKANRMSLEILKAHVEARNAKRDTARV
jgi:Domain of unknown function (DUF4112)